MAILAFVRCLNDFSISISQNGMNLILQRDFVLQRDFSYYNETLRLRWFEHD